MKIRIEFDDADAVHQALKGSVGTHFDKESAMLSKWVTDLSKITVEFDLAVGTATVVEVENELES